MFASSLGTILAFSILRPKNKIVYMPRYKYSHESKRPPKLDDGLLSWLTPLAKVTEDELIIKIGLDAVVFLRFLRMCRWMCSSLALLACTILIPSDLYYNLKASTGQSLGFANNRLAMVTISNIRGKWVLCFPMFSFLWFKSTICSWRTQTQDLLVCSFFFFSFTVISTSTWHMLGLLLESSVILSTSIIRLSFDYVGNGSGVKNIKTQSMLVHSWWPTSVRTRLLIYPYRTL